MLRPCFALAALLVGVTAVLNATSAALAAADRPNIIFVLTDDQRFDTLGCMGNAVIQTPHIDRLAAQGTVFTNAFCTTSICSISRASYLTGQYASRHGIVDFRTPLSAEQFAQTFPALLRRAGYRTAFIGKWGVGNQLPTDEYDVFQGFPGQGRYFPKGKAGEPGEHLTHKLGDQAVAFLDGCRPGEPFVLQLSTKAAHCQDGEEWQFQFDPRYGDLYTSADIPRPATATAADFQNQPEFLQTSEARNRWKIRFATPEMFQKSVKDYYRLITGVDDVVGRMLTKLKEKGLAENTVIIYTSDNGFYLGDHGLAGKWFMHEASIRLPLVIYDPRLPEPQRGRAVSPMALNIDIAPTICDLAGVTPPDAMQGRSLVPLLRGADVPWRDAFFYEHPFVHRSIPQTEGVRDRRWKYTRYVSVEPVYEELFDLETDPHEQHNLAGDPRHAEKLAEMRGRWRQWRERVKSSRAAEPTDGRHADSD